MKINFKGRMKKIEIVLFNPTVVIKLSTAAPGYSLAVN